MCCLLPEEETFYEQLHHVKKQKNIQYYFKNKNLVDFLNMYIQIDYLFNNINKKSDTFVDKLAEIETLTNDDMIKELINIIKFQICVPSHISNDNFNREVDKSINCNQKICDLEKKIKKYNEKDSKNLFDNLNKCLYNSEISCDKNNKNNENNFFIKKKDKPDIFLYSRDSKLNISSVEIEKFQFDLKEHNCCGILYNNNGGIVGHENFEIDILNNNVYIYILNKYNEDSEDILKLAINIIYNIYDIIRDNKMGIIEIDKELFLRLKLEYTHFLTTHSQYINSIKSNIMALEKLTFTQLDHFFKRTHINSDDKPYSCQLCGTKFGSDKTLKSHLKSKHEIQLAKTRRPKQLKEPEPEPEPELDVIHF